MVFKDVENARELMAGARTSGGSLIFGAVVVFTNTGFEGARDQRGGGDWAPVELVGIGYWAPAEEPVVGNWAPKDEDEVGFRAPGRRGTREGEG